MKRRGSYTHYQRYEYKHKTRLHFRPYAWSCPGIKKLFYRVLDLCCHLFADIRLKKFNFNDQNYFQYRQLTLLLKKLSIFKQEYLFKWEKINVRWMWIKCCVLEQQKNVINKWFTSFCIIKVLPLPSRREISILIFWSKVFFNQTFAYIGFTLAKTKLIQTGAGLYTPKFTKRTSLIIGNYFPQV